MEGEMPRSLSALVATAGLVLASVAVAAVLMEIALRVLPIDLASYHSITGFAVYDPELGWKLAPSHSMTFRGAHFAVRVTHNAEGLRDRHYDYARTPGRRRILVLGDSVVWCWGVEQDDCFTERLERALGDTDDINAGVPGWSTAQELLFYEREGRRYGSDTVVLVIAPNDPDDNVDPRGPRFRLEDGVLRHDTAPPPRRHAALHEWLQHHSRLFVWLDYVGPALRKQLHVGAEEHEAAPPAAVHADTGGDTPAPGPRPTPATWPLAEALFDRLRTDVTADGARLVVMLEMMDEHRRAWLRDFWAARGVPCVELAPLFLAVEARGQRVRLVGDPHLDAPGQAIMADELRRVLDSMPAL
jgi:hypothetical protein